CRKFRNVIRTNDEINLGQCLEESLSLLLGDTPSHTDDQVGALPLHDAETTDFAPQLLLGLLSDTASVEQHDIALFHRRGLLVTSPEEHLLHARRIMGVHLAPECHDAKARHWG